MTDNEIIQGLIAKDNRITQAFFFEECRPLFCKIISQVFSYDVDYDEFVNELYVYLMENDAQKLRGFEYRSSVYMWLKVLAIRFFIKKRDRMIDITPERTHYDWFETADSVDEHDFAKDDLQKLFSQMSSERYVYVLKELFIEGCEPDELAFKMGVTTANLYNIKRRAVAQLTRIALNDIKEYGK